MLKRIATTVLTMVGLCLALFLAGCGPEDNNSNSNGNTGNTSSGVTLSIVSGSENKTLEPIIKQWARDNGHNIQISYEGSVDISLELEKGASGQYDGVWPANSMWIALGDRTRVVKNIKSIYRSPVVFGVKKSKAEELGWVGKDVTVADILAASKSGKLRFMMTSATQSNSGSSMYMGFLYAFAGSPDVLSMDNLDDPKVRDQVKSILGRVNRTAGSSGWLKDLFVQQHDYYDAMVNYEAMVIETNQELARIGAEQLYAVYPVDGLSLADSPLGYVNKGDAAKEKVFLELQDYLLSAPVQQQLLALGRRTGLGVNVANADARVFDKSLGLDVDRVLTPINMPEADVIRQALTLYQTAFRKPSLTIFALDFSGSMSGNPEQQLKSAMRGLLDQDLAAKYLLQASPEDITIIVPFNGSPIGVRSVKGNDPKKLSEAIQWVESLNADGGTDIYAPIGRGVQELAKYPGWQDYSVAVILMTDGESEGSMQTLMSGMQTAGAEGVPIYSIMFGKALSSQLDALAKATSGRVFDGKKDLISAFRQAKGYN